MTIQFWFMLLMTIIIVVASVLQHLSEKRTKAMTEISQEKVNEINIRLTDELRSLSVSANQVNTFKHHIRMLLVDLERDRNERTAAAIEDAERDGKALPKQILYNEIYELSELIHAERKNVRRGFYREAEKKLNRLRWVAINTTNGVGKDGD